ncbi:phage tail protein [Leptospira kanakyensis]|uniref:Phage tail protein n=1 Tax=Leptospira kanakyensis TaxID=2484968 RepID=A0A6N4Q5Z9_9LEPT|nr:LysM peptidoglycan-binding domain-containing protein [Leptospira kanakyensis]TGK47508.1 phage tail protein [Leptospira kanakyensis]TGK63489.1 phage tail protein [Leptospira kanakyensis]TGK67093.1 phage tail protein [Leptospira kanakyensis]
MISGKSNERIHVVTFGETLQRIAAYYWGDWTLWPVLRDDNAFYNSKLGFKWCDDLKEGMKLFVRRELPVSNQVHTVTDIDTYTSLSDQYYKTEHFAYLIRNINNSQILKYSLGGEIVIPALVDKRVFQAAQMRLN